MSVFHPVAAAAATATESIFTPYYLFILLTCLVCGTARKLSSPASLFHPPVCSKQVHMSRLASYQCGSSANYYEQENKKWGWFLSVPIQQNLTTIAIYMNSYTLMLYCIKLRVLLSNKVFPNNRQFSVLGEHQLHTLTLTYWQYFLHTHEHIFFLSFFGFPLCGRIGAARGPAASMICRQKILICGMILLIQRWVPFYVFILFLRFVCRFFSFRFHFFLQLKTQKY